MWVIFIELSFILNMLFAILVAQPLNMKCQMDK